MTDLTTLRRLAEAATPGPWYLHTSDDTLVSSESGEIVQAQGEYMIEYASMEADAAYIAAANPQAILALLDRLERQSALCAAMAKWLHWSDLPDDAVVLAWSGEGAFCITAGMIREAMR